MRFQGRENHAGRFLPALLRMSVMPYRPQAQTWRLLCLLLLWLPEMSVQAAGRASIADQRPHSISGVPVWGLPNTCRKKMSILRDLAAAETLDKPMIKRPASWSDGDQRHRPGCPRQVEVKYGRESGREREGK